MKFVALFLLCSEELQRRNTISIIWYPWVDATCAISCSHPAAKLPEDASLCQKKTGERMKCSPAHRKCAVLPPLCKGLRAQSLEGRHSGMEKAGESRAGAEGLGVKPPAAKSQHHHTGQIPQCAQSQSQTPEKASPIYQGSGHTLKWLGRKYMWQEK